MICPLAVQWTKELLDTQHLGQQHAETSGSQRSESWTSPAPEGEEQDTDPTPSPMDVNEEHSQEGDSGNPDNEDSITNKEQGDNGMSDFELGDEDMEDRNMDDDLDFDDHDEDEDEHELELEPPKQQNVHKNSSLLPSSVQAIYVFPSFGKLLDPGKFSENLGKTTEEFLGVELQGQAWQHVTIAIQQGLLCLVDDMGSTMEDSVFESQCAHSHQTSRIHYGVLKEDRTLVGLGSIEKYVHTSKLWQDWLDGKPAPTSSR
ncbi:hypothetical protein FRC07_000067 [Ceratobasidium sp. 392]|nr:hypothetical protein FRC07_000067 [Ceratobasidium sp. 392]